MSELIGVVTPDNTYNLAGQISGESALSGIVTAGAQYEAYSGSYSVTPSGSVQTLETDGKLMTDDVTVGAIPSDYIGTDIPRRSSISVSQDNNTIHVDDGYYEDDIDTSMGACTVTGASVSIDSQGDATGSIIVGRGGYINSGSHAFYVDDVVTPRSSSDLTASGATVSVPYGYYPADASKTVASGSAGTPTATKGSVSNHAVNVTPSVTNTTGYITGGTVTGTAVSVSASELVSGNKAITENGTGIDVANYSTVSVDVQSGSTVSVVDTTDSGGGTVRTITALDISDTTATAEDVASGKYFYTAAGTKTQGTATIGGDTLEWKASRAIFPSFGGIYSGKNLTLDFDNKVQSLPSINYMGMSDGANGKLTLKNLSSSLTSSNMNLGDFLRQAPTFKEIDLGGAAPASMTRWLYQWNYSANSKFATTPITITNLSLDNLSSQNTSFNSGGTYAQSVDIYFLGYLKNSINLSAWVMLNADSWNRLIERLYDYSGGDTHTLTVGNTILALIDSAHQAIATARGWTLA